MLVLGFLIRPKFLSLFVVPISSIVSFGVHLGDASISQRTKVMALSYCSAALSGDVEIQVLCDFSKHSSRMVTPLNSDNKV
jgi:hypothetical protein